MHDLYWQTSNHICITKRKGDKMVNKQLPITEAIDAAIRSNKIEGLNLSAEARLMLERVKKGEVSLEEFEKAATIKYTAYAKGETITYEQALTRIKENTRSK